MKLLLFVLALTWACVIATFWASANSPSAASAIASLVVAVICTAAGIISHSIKDV